MLALITSYWRDCNVILYLWWVLRNEVRFSCVKSDIQSDASHKHRIRIRNRHTDVQYTRRQNTGVINVGWGTRWRSWFKALCFKLEGRGFDSRWCHWNFSLTILPALLWPWDWLSLYQKQGLSSPVMGFLNFYLLQLNARIRSVVLRR